MHDKFIDALRRGRFKGTTRLITEDVVTKKREIVEDHNMFTAALDKIFDVNALGMMNYYTLLPITKLIGGIFLFWNPITESAENIYPENQGVNKLVGFAGQTSHSTDNPYRGNPNGAASEIDPDNGLVRFVWDWTLEQGIGEIRACSLTSSAAGDRGLYPAGDQMLQTMGLVIEGISRGRYGETLGSTYNTDYAIRCPYWIDNDGIGRSVFVSGNTFREFKVRHPFVRPMLIENPSFATADNYTVESTRQCTLSRSYTANYCCVGQDDSYYYIMERDSSTSTRLYIDKVAKSNMTVTSYVVDLAGVTLGRPAMTFAMMNGGIVSDGFVYWISGSNAKTFVRIDLTTPANSVELTSYLTGNISLNDTPIVLNDGLILGRNYFINGDFVYPVGARSERDDEYMVNDAYAKYKNSPMLYQIGNGDPGLAFAKCTTGGVLLLPYLATINNLQTPVYKTANKTLRCEYVVQLSGGN